MITDAEREKLHQFLGAYFHEDWHLEADSPEQVLSEFRKSKTGPELHELSRIIAAYVHEHPDDEELGEALFLELGCYYSPHAVGLSSRAWLLGVAAKLAASSDA